MKAVQFTDFQESEIVEIEREDPGPSEVEIKIDRVQLSVTECDLIMGVQKKHYEQVKHRIESGDSRLFGHEFCGHITEIGTGVTDFEVGDRVYAPGKISCGECVYCDRQYPELCKSKQGIGYERPGALAEYLLLPTEPLAKLPDDVSDAAGAAMQPLASTILCVDDSGLSSGDVAVIYGAGVMGLQCGQIAMLKGAKDVFAVDIDERKLDLAASMGMDPIDGTEGSVSERIKTRTDGIGADVVFECVGGPQESATDERSPLGSAFQSVREGGTIVQVGHIAGDVSLTPREYGSKMVSWVNPQKGVISLGPNSDNGRFAPELVADGRVSIEEFTTHELHGLEKLDELVDITLNKPEHDALGPAQLIL
ncbi:zinc-dependent alcohol dehydrogenase [Halorubrum sp. DTA98]|uniref:zinc-dependent alcohol dehydrogenase n=1 Tax=Halorubrum sp. DTA98 TaxID=3402163 RepID=UPI003AAE5885